MINIIMKKKGLMRNYKSDFLELIITQSGGKKLNIHFSPVSFRLPFFTPEFSQALPRIFYTSLCQL